MPTIAREVTLPAPMPNESSHAAVSGMRPNGTCIFRMPTSASAVECSDDDEPTNSVAGAGAKAVVSAARGGGALGVHDDLRASSS